VAVRAGVLRTSGSRALGLDIATNPATCVLVGNGGCDVTAAADQITTDGFGGIVALVSGETGVTTIDVAALQTGGDEAAGLDLSANPTVCATLGAGACDQNFTVGDLTTRGANSPGALVRAAGVVATSPGCSAISITASGSVTSAQGTGILASSVSVTTLAGAPVGRAHQVRALLA
jgi:hypothetical protein